MKRIGLTLAVFTIAICVGCGGSSSPTPSPTPAPPTITGTWTGTVSSAVFTGSSGISGKLTQGTTNPDGSINFSGTLNLTNSCITTITITNGLIAGGQFQLAGSTQDGGTISVKAILNAVDTQMNGNYATTTGSVCSADNGTFVMGKQ